MTWPDHLWNSRAIIISPAITNLKSDGRQAKHGNYGRGWLSKRCTCDYIYLTCIILLQGKVAAKSPDMFKNEVSSAKTKYRLAQSPVAQSMVARRGPLWKLPPYFESIAQLFYTMPTFRPYWLNTFLRSCVIQATTKQYNLNR